ncbi:hypothetical protein LB533_20425 [Mesorhizobium sp. BR1-1-13]|uniref:hypothetical protein n=1 Tax=Mesorhizobium sp. BR1-1-13 TaxID=2876656 RepID=UPI001CD12102|nr:hypothetical protein [Mesorhizobium sp. BR1-1-13]MBZ9943455.1 hypothetical protein [Mesorhizobium sp. BR1-1-13]
MNDKQITRTVAGDGSSLSARMTYGDHERAEVHAQKRRLAARASIGKDWDGAADNDNAVNWPVGKALLAEGNTDLLKYALAYRKIYDMAKGEVLIGIKGQPAPDMQVVRQSWVDGKTGEIKYGGEIRIKSAPADVAPTRSTPTNSESKKNAAPVPRPWTGDRAINDTIDAREMLPRLQAAVGSILEPFEMAIVDCATLQEVGNAAGVANRGGAMAAGRAIVHMGLMAVSGLFGHVGYKDMAV